MSPGTQNEDTARRDREDRYPHCIHSGLLRGLEPEIESVLSQKTHVKNSSLPGRRRKCRCPWKQGTRASFQRLTPGQLPAHYAICMLRNEAERASSRVRAARGQTSATGQQKAHTLLGELGWSGSPSVSEKNITGSPPSPCPKSVAAVKQKDRCTLPRAWAPHKPLALARDHAGQQSAPGTEQCRQRSRGHRRADGEAALAKRALGELHRGSCDPAQPLTASPGCRAVPGRQRWSQPGEAMQKWHGAQDTRWESTFRAVGEIL